MTSAQSKNNARRQKILDDAWELLLNEGAAALSLRAIAKKTGLKLASLQYYFPTKKALDNALIDELIARYAQRTEQIERHDDPAELLDALIDMFLDATPAVAALYFELGTLVQRDPETAKKIGESYETGLRRLARILQRVNPALNKKQAFHRAMTITAATDGARSLQLLADDIDSADRATLANTVLAACKAFVMAPEQLDH